MPAVSGRELGMVIAGRFSDAAAYALTKINNLVLLFKGNDFVQTDIVPASMPLLTRWRCGSTVWPLLFMRLSRPERSVHMEYSA